MLTELWLLAFVFTLYMLTRTADIFFFFSPSGFKSLKKTFYDLTAATDIMNSTIRRRLTKHRQMSWNPTVCQATWFLVLTAGFMVRSEDLSRSGFILHVYKSDNHWKAMEDQFGLESEYLPAKDLQPIFWASYYCKRKKKTLRYIYNILNNAFQTWNSADEVLELFPGMWSFSGP